MGGGIMRERLGRCTSRPSACDVPYRIGTNDVRFAQTADLYDDCLGAFDWLMREGQVQPCMVPIGPHLRTIDRLGRTSGPE
jgi:hypothetical protein